MIMMTMWVHSVFLPNKLCRQYYAMVFFYYVLMYLCEAVMRDLPGPTAPSWIYLANIVSYCAAGFSISLEANTVW